MSSSLKAAIDPISNDAVAKNQTLLVNLRHLFALAGGAAAGALRLESTSGFAFYGAIYIASILLMFFISVGRMGSYFQNAKKALLWDGVAAAFPGYILAWSLVYSLVET